MGSRHDPGASTRTAIRLLGPDDADASVSMSGEAFGAPPVGVSAFTLGEGIWRWGLFDGDMLAAKANDRAYDSMIGGRPVPTAGVAGVAVAPEYRGLGFARQVMRHLLWTARDRGAVVATLFRTAPSLYRSIGFENVAELRTVELPAAALNGVRKPDGVILRRAGVGDVAAARAVYGTVAAGGSCLLTRQGHSFPAGDDAWLRGSGQVTLALDAGGQLLGYARWERGTGYGPGAVLSVTDLQAVAGDGYAALLAMIGSFSAVTPVVRLHSSGTDPVGWFVPGGGWAVTKVEPYLMRVIDVVGAVAARGWPPGSDGSVTLSFEDPVCPWNSGTYRLQVCGGRGVLTVGDGATGSAVVVGARGFAVLYAGGVPPATLRLAGLLRGGTDADDAFLAAAFAGPQPAILDFF